MIPPPIMHKIFRYPNFSETLKGCPRNFSALWDQNFSTEKRDRPLFIHKTFWNQNFSEKSRIPLRKFSALWDIKISTQKRDKPPLIHKFFSKPENFRKTEGFFYKAFRFGLVRLKNFDKTVMPLPLLCMKVLKRIFLKHQNVRQWNIWVHWDGKSWYHPSYP